MKVYNWNQDKNDQLKSERGVCFEEIVMAINENKIVDVFDHPNQGKYPGQKIYAVLMDDYIYLVPFISSGGNENEIFLKTIIPSRKATKKYLGGIGNE